MNQELWEKAVAFHGHACPGLAIGAVSYTHLTLPTNREV